MTVTGFYTMGFFCSAESCTDFAKPKEQQPLQFWNTNGNFKGLVFVWESAMCQHAALRIKVTVCVCMRVFLVIPLPACFSGHLILKANYGKIHQH